MLIVAVLAITGWLVMMRQTDQSGVRLSNILPAAPPADSEQFVGSAQCAECHAKIAEEFSLHPMSRSASVLSDFPRSGSEAEFKTGAFDYQIEHSNEGFFHREIVRDTDQTQLASRAMPVHLAIGSGERGISYLSNNSGVLVQSPLTWYSQDQRWDLSPGYVANKSDRFERRIGDACLFCHVGRTASIKREVDGRYHAASPFLEDAIGCERCHGPGQNHADHYRKGTGDRGGGGDHSAGDHSAGDHSAGDHSAGVIVNPAKLSSSLQDAVCYQCHLTAKRVLRYGCREFDFRAGNPLSSVWTMFVEEQSGHHKEREKAVTHVQQMEVSRCYIGSGGKMSCLSCHDAHSVPAAAEKTKYYRDRCVECHTPDHDCKLPLETRSQAPADNSCITCHMPGRGTTDIAHLTQTDHRVVRTAQLSDNTTLDHLDHHAVSLRPIDAETAALPEWEVRRGRGIACYQQFLESPQLELLTTAEQLLSETVRMVPEDVAAQRTLGVVFQFLQQPEKALHHLELAAKLDPEDDDTLTLLGVIFLRNGDYQSALEYFQRSLKLNPGQAESYGRMAQIQSAFQDDQSALELLRKGIESNPTSLELRDALVGILNRMGNAEEAERQSRIADRIRLRMPQ